MPHAWMIVTPSLSKASISAGGQAEPPTIASRSGARSCGCALSWASRPCQMVGTAPAMVGFSVAMICASGSGCRNRSGMISDAPTIIAAYGRPHDIAWNCGTITSARSAWRSPIDSVMHTCIECSQIERCEYATPFGLPVVPDV